MSKNWKSFERFLARCFKGIRHPVTGRPGEFPDVETNRFAIEAKTRKSVPDYLMCKENEVKVTKDGYVIMRLETFIYTAPGAMTNNAKRINRTMPSYIKKWMSQATGFDKIPIVIIHRNATRYLNSVVVMRQGDAIIHFGEGKSDTESHRRLYKPF